MISGKLMETRGNQSRVLFMHGLESGVGGSKDCYLRQHFDVLTPDMQMSVCRRDRTKSVINNILRQPLFWGWADRVRCGDEGSRWGRRT